MYEQLCPILCSYLLCSYLNHPADQSSRHPNDFGKLETFLSLGSGSCALYTLYRFLMVLPIFSWQQFQVFFIEILDSSWLGRLQRQPPTSLVCWSNNSIHPYNNIYIYIYTSVYLIYSYIHIIYIYTLYI